MALPWRLDTGFRCGRCWVDARSFHAPLADPHGPLLPLTLEEVDDLLQLAEQPDLRALALGGVRRNEATLAPFGDERFNLRSQARDLVLAGVDTALDLLEFWALGHA